ncbi:bridging integrator 3-like [Brevipalpus obovatus]|uniref:bridging integrator 3-like n=1 Tax=Brevipalpus obovatus TaxID=246614 RepID=UPI003D9DEF50
MSWNPLRKIAGKSHGNDPEEILIQLGGLPGVIQSDEFEKINQKAANVEDWTKRIHRSSKKINEGIIKMNQFESQLAKDLATTSLCQVHFPKFRELVEDWHDFIRETTEQGDDLAVAVQKMVIDPTKKYQTLTTDVRGILKKHEQTWENLNKLKIKQQQLVKKDKTGSIFVQIENNKTQIAKTEDELKNQSKVITDQVPAVLDCRVKYFQPCLEGLIKSKILFWGDSFNAFNSHPRISESQNSWKSWNEYSSKQTDLLGSISSLSIVEGSK